MNFAAIDWPNIVATLASACLGGWIASRIAVSQMAAAQAAERAKSRREIARELIEAIDSLLHIAYRDNTNDGTLQRQRLRRRILSLVAMCIPERFVDTQDHLDRIDAWWHARQRAGVRPTGMGFTATEDFFYGIKSELFEAVFGMKAPLSRTNQGDAEQP
jgi:hypothetical protein